MRTEVWGSLIAGVAQLVEQRIRNAEVRGSNPLTGTIFAVRKLTGIINLEVI